ncbi:hypothetical protein [Sulfuricurvum sp.]|uniref:hypothetical protein n=1 Tax=Sulfuricurvum sp. TaxID=2025608 RepID=UPI0019BA1DC1|nr:hypothetical protein [Sulfuricurvum sp.]MBD3799237.1 hypothetical protein [Campylobacterota bacterium]MBD3806526.1 hypothetical protein [Sulfuricurvum sp.]
MREKTFFLVLLGINFLVLLLQIQGLSIGYHEAQILYGELNPLQFIIKASLSLFGYNDYALRLPMIGLHLLSVVLLYSISTYYVSRERDRLWIVLIYMLLPGVTSAALVVDDAGLIIASLFLFIYLYLRFGRFSLLLTPYLIWIDPSFAYLFVGIVVYGALKKEFIFLGVGSIALVVSLLQFGLHIGGSPESRFLDALGVYAAIFSPIVFIYLFYVLYRRAFSKEWDLLWTIATSAFVISLLLSFRQKVEVQKFAPFLLITLPLAAQTFLHTYRIRLREFRLRYRILFYSAFVLLVINTMVVFFNQYLYRFLDEPKHHFSYPMHVAKELANELKKNRVTCINANDKKLQLRLLFYGITHCEDYRLDATPSENSKKVTISYINTPIYFKYVTILNK